MSNRLPNIQKALLIPKRFGTPVVDTIPIPKPAEGQVLVKVHSVGLNPADAKIWKHDLGQATYPLVLGLDIAGEIVEIGNGVKGFSKGDRVTGYARLKAGFSGFAQYALIVAGTFGKIPSSISYDEAATLPVALTTGFLGLYSSTFGLGLEVPFKSGREAYRGTPIVILGGSSSVGQVAIQLAKLSGFCPIITTAQPQNSDALKAIGATHLIDRNLASKYILEQVRRITDNKAIFHIFDAIAIPSTQHLAVEILAPRGRVVLVNSAVKDLELKEGREAIRIQSQPSFPHNVPIVVKIYGEWLGELLEGHLKPNRVEVLPRGLHDITDGLERLDKESVSRLKLVAHPQETS